MFKAWNTATPAQLSGSLLLLVKTKQIIGQDMVGYCFFRPLLSLRSMAVLVGRVKVGRETAWRLREQLEKRRSFSRVFRANFAASPLVRPAR